MPFFCLVLLLLSSSGTLVTTPNPFQIPKDAEYEIVLNAEQTVFSTPESVSIQYSIRNLGTTKLFAPDMVWGFSLVWDGKAYKRDPQHTPPWNGPAEIIPKGSYGSTLSLSEFLVPANLLTPGRHTIALKHASTESNTQTIFIEKGSADQPVTETQEKTGSAARSTNAQTARFAPVSGQVDPALDAVRREFGEEQYRDSFRDYLQVAKACAEKMDITVLSRVTDEFQKDHQRPKLVEIFVWHKDVVGKNGPLFSKKYFEKTIAWAAVKLGDPSKVNVFFQEGYAVVDYSPRESKVSYRLVFLK